MARGVQLYLSTRTQLEFPEERDLLEATTNVRKAPTLWGPIWFLHQVYFCQITKLSQVESSRSGLKYKNTKIQKNTKKTSQQCRPDNQADPGGNCQVRSSRSNAPQCLEAPCTAMFQLPYCYYYYCTALHFVQMHPLPLSTLLMPFQWASTMSILVLVPTLQISRQTRMKSTNRMQSSLQLSVYLYLYLYLYFYLYLRGDVWGEERLLHSASIDAKELLSPI